MSNVSKYEVVVTAGGTIEKIDDVRYIGNVSSGRFGLALADRAKRLGRSVALIAPVSCVERFGLPEGVSHLPYLTTDDLASRLLSVTEADLVLHAAAVSDYRPQRTAGKISSDNESLTITCERTPKILSLLRGHFGDDTVIAGFKLLTGVSVDQLVGVAHQQIVSNSTDYCVANLLEDIHDGQRSVHLVERGSEHARRISGNTADVADQLLGVMLEG
jgi:phosphopantothenoylcysteine decarboxylase/phosphopantothenate--cysteine ligase